MLTVPAGVARAFQRGFAYTSPPPFGAGRPETAPSMILVCYHAGIAQLPATRERQACRAAACPFIRF
ncbi:hypothetical protein HLH36_00470 [Gluconacetobacter aggeris]|uniref:Uncharacterized protein n=1 Tax=Gluconacetobacter aggeris TaxID=1286186 RepID=A0A7W4NUQ7_9PROT|nr:hypothetical protein [Gluconacetobacter aggeris]MBB2166844.1 hypothetical protein [Gluconacetobacter aggeris]